MDSLASPRVSPEYCAKVSVGSEGREREAYYTLTQSPSKDTPTGWRGGGHKKWGANEMRTCTMRIQNTQL